MATTKLDNLINPEVLADFVNKNLFGTSKFIGLADVDYTLVGNPGDTLTFPAFNKIDDAQELTEGSECSLSLLTASSTTATVVCIGNGVELTDESILSGAGDPFGEAGKQIAQSIDKAFDVKMLTLVSGITGDQLYSTSASAFTANDINEALEIFGENVDEVKALVCDPAFAKVLRKGDWLPASEIAADRVVRGAVGEAYGCQVIISDRLKNRKDAYIVKPGALRFVLKRDTLIEADRDIVKRTNVVTGSKHAACYIYNKEGVIKMLHA